MAAHDCPESPQEITSSRGIRRASVASRGTFRANLNKYAHAWEYLRQIVDFQDVLLHKRAIVPGLLAENFVLDRQDDGDDYTNDIDLVGVTVGPITDGVDLRLALTEIDGSLARPGIDDHAFVCEGRVR
ncbi:hypothetical protein [Corynebacterium sp. MSK218]|uniref:hypothetical protein n=1 Tax=Corynebacterium sp. MSK218 TaxID=3050218 RepID=UPI00254EA406|nr:hypothetical protein [Corynebacterium sp. MSK218]